MEAAHPDPDGRVAKVMEDHVFVLRLWLERAEAGGHAAPLWRGRVKYLNRDEEVHVDGIEAAVQVVRAALPPTPSAQTE